MDLLLVEHNNRGCQTPFLPPANNYMNKIMEEVLTHADVRDVQSAKNMIARVMNAGSPWAAAE
jgi:hypothetical protein